MKEFWDERYAEEAYAYGKEPNQFFQQALKHYNVKGTILMAAEGEGRNAVYAAKKGLLVSAFDISPEGRKKALKLAKEENVPLAYEVGNLLELDLTKQKFDAVALIFAHFPPDILTAYHKHLAELLKAGGLLILEGFSKNHLELQAKNPQVGGPKNIDMLFSTKSIKADFEGLEIIELEEKEVKLAEGQYHQGLSRTVRFVGQKPA